MTLHAILVRAVVLSMWMVVVQVANAAAQIVPTDEKFREMARDLISGIEQYRPLPTSGRFMDKAIAYLQNAYNAGPKDRVRIAIWPFDTDSLPITKDTAAELNDRLFTALIKQARGRFDFVARDGLKALINDLEQTGAIENAKKNPLATLMENAKDVDILIQGRIKLQLNDLKVSYKATSVDGRVVAATRTYSLPTAVNTTANVSLDQAVKRAAQELVDGTKDMNEMRIGGFQYQGSGEQTPFGLRFKELLSSEIIRRANNAISGRRLRVKELHGIATRGTHVDAKDLGDRQLGASKGSYLLTGMYWQLGEEVEILASLKNPEGATVPWMGRVKRADIGNTRISPIGDIASIRENDGGPVSFQLSTDRGSDPVYQIGETMNLVFRVGRDAWIYCFYGSPNGSVIQILPNPHFWQNSNEPKFKGGIAYVVPGDKTFPFKFRFAPPTGVEFVKCFAMSRDVTTDLPAALRGKSLEPLPKQVSGRLSHLFREVRDTLVTEATLAVTVVEKK